MRWTSTYHHVLFTSNLPVDLEKLCLAKIEFFAHYSEKYKKIYGTVSDDGGLSRPTPHNHLYS